MRVSVSAEAKKQLEVGRQISKTTHKKHIRIYVCIFCRKMGGTLGKFKNENGLDYYAHRSCKNEHKAH
jgi:hypothetical protein